MGWSRGRTGWARAGRDVLGAHATARRPPPRASDAARLITERFAAPYVLGRDTHEHLPEVLSGFGIAGGAVYDALVALAAVEHNATLATRDVRAKATYDAIGARTIIAG